MATDAQFKGDIDKNPFELVGRTETWAEQRSMEVTVVGKKGSLNGVLKPGDDAGVRTSWFGNDRPTQWFVKNLVLTSPDGVTEELRATLVKCPSGKKDPYNYTYDISMEEVQMPLMSHPDILKNCDLDILAKWEDTPLYARIAKPKSGSGGSEDVNKYDFYYFDFNSSTGTGSYERKKITGSWEIAYCKAVAQGITTYNKYLPVLTRMSYYLELPGANYDGNTHIITGGTVREFTGADQIGKFDSNPPLTINGYTSANGVWFKNGDKFTSQPDGSWVRTETWVFTNDKNHTWIYTGQLGN